MKEKTFVRSKGEVWDGDEDFIHYLEEELTEEHEDSWPRLKENFEITIQIRTLK